MDPEICYPDFSLLPPHIIAHILGYLRFPDLKNASTVCKSWQYSSIDPIIMRNIALRPKEEDFPEIIRLNRKCGGLNLHRLNFDKVDSYYWKVFEKFCPFINKLQIINSNLSLNHLLKLLELTMCLEAVSLNRCAQYARFTELFPPDFDCHTKQQIIKNLSGIKKFEFDNISNFRLIADFVRHAPNLETFECSNNIDCFENFFTIFDNYDASKLKHLYWNLRFSRRLYINEFIERFVKIKNLNLTSFGLVLRWYWEGKQYKSFVFLEFVLKLQNLVEFSIQDLRYDQLSIICQYMINLKRLDCRFNDNLQPISKLANLKQLEKLRCGCPRNYYEYYSLWQIAQIDKFFKYKFENLTKFYFEEFVTESNLIQFCENHSNLIELELTGLLTRNLEIIFKHLTKLRIVHISFGSEWLSREARHTVKDVPIFDSNQSYEYKISRLQDLEVFYLGELVAGIHEDDVRQLKKLRSTNLSELFGKTTEIITQILGYLPIDEFINASSLCKSWFYASTDPEISRTLALVPSDRFHFEFAEICKTNRRYGLLKLKKLDLDKIESECFPLIEKFCPFIHTLQIIRSNLKIHHLFKLLEYSKRLEYLSLDGCGEISELPSLFLIDDVSETKNRIITNLAGLQNIELLGFENITFIADFLLYTTKLESMKIHFIGNPHYSEFFKIFVDDNTGSLRHLCLSLNLVGYIDDFIKCFIKLNNVKLRSFKINIRWIWQNNIYKSSLFDQFMVKLQSLEELSIMYPANYGLMSIELSRISQHLVNLKKFHCVLGNGVGISELGNLKKLENLRCWIINNEIADLDEIEKFFKCKFEHLRLFEFKGLVTQASLKNFCKNHPNLIELQLNKVVTRNLEIIFKCLTKLRKLRISFDCREMLTTMDDLICGYFDTKKEYHYKISRLHDLEIFYLSERVSGIVEDHVAELKKLRETNYYHL